MHQLSFTVQAYELHLDRLIVDKIQPNKLEWAGNSIRVSIIEEETYQTSPQVFNR